MAFYRESDGRKEAIVRLELGRIVGGTDDHVLCPICMRELQIINCGIVQEAPLLVWTCACGWEREAVFYCEHCDHAEVPHEGQTCASCWVEIEDEIEQEYERFFGKLDRRIQ